MFSVQRPIRLPRTEGADLGAGPAGGAAVGVHPGHLGPPDEPVVAVGLAVHQRQAAVQTAVAQGIASPAAHARPVKHLHHASAPAVADDGLGLRQGDGLVLGRVGPAPGFHPLVHGKVGASRVVTATVHRAAATRSYGDDALFTSRPQQLDGFVGGHGLASSASV